jgi:integrase
MKMKLTDRAVSRLKPPASGRVDVWDLTLPAFGIQLRATGRRAWIIAVRRPGSTTTSRIKIGDPAVMPLQNARARAQDLMRNNPGASGMPTGELGSLTAESPMADVIRAFIAHRRLQKRNRTWRATEQLLRGNLAGWYARPIRSISKQDVRQVLSTVVARGAPSTANLLLANVARMFNWAVEQELLDVSPAAAIKPPSPKVERDRVLTGPELRAVWRGATLLGWPFGPVVKLLMLTGQREGEVAAMRWEDLDLATGAWALASSQTKADRAHLVPLSGAALQIIGTLPRLASSFVFPGRRTNGARPICGFSKAKVRLDRLCGVTGWVFHDLRRSAATEMARLKVPPHVTEKILNHRASAVVGPMGRVYQRYDYLDERRDALELWGQSLLRIVTDS